VSKIWFYHISVCCSFIVLAQLEMSKTAKRVSFLTIRIDCWRDLKAKKWSPVD